MTEMNPIYTERAVLSTCLNRLNSGIFSRIIITGGNNSEELFSEYVNKLVFRAIGSVYDRGMTPSIASVADRLGDIAGDDIDSPLALLQEISMETPINNMNALDSAIQDIAKAKTLRSQIKEMERLLTDVKSGEAEVEPSDISARLGPISEMAEIEDDSEVFSEMVTEIIDSDRPPMWTISTRINSIDSVLGGRGLESGTLTVIAARPKVGKTIFMNSLINNVLDEGGVPLVINLETKKVEFAAKVMASHMRNDSLPWDVIKRRLSNDPELNLNTNQEKDFQKGVEWAKDQEWRVTFNKSMNIPDIRALIVNAKSELPEGTKIVLFVDYLQLQVSDTSHEREEISALTKFYKTVATELDISVVTLAQLNREGANGGRPYVHHLKSSGSIEQDADVVLLLDRPAVTDNNVSPNLMKVYGSVTRLAGGEDFELFSDGASNTIYDMTPAYSQMVSGFVPKGQESFGDELIDSQPQVQSKTYGEGL